MPTSWHAEALNAQAYAARTYSYTAYKGTVRDYDVTDDQADQCYGGTRVEVPTSNAAVTATGGRVITYQGASIRAYFASSNGGYTLSDGCWMNNVIRSGSTWVCSAGQPYLARSEERRVGKECRSRWSAGDVKERMKEVM